MNNKLIKRYSLAEITLLLIFMLGLIFSYIFVKARQKINLSDPIALQDSGLAVSLPTNPGWTIRETNWRYESNSSMVLVAQHQIVRNVPDTSVRWRYVICGSGDSARDILERRLKNFKADTENIQTITGPVTMDYAVIHSENPDDAVRCLGVVLLDYGRRLELEIMTYQQFDISYSERLLHALAAGIIYQSPPQLKAGKQLVKDFWEQFSSDDTALAKKAEQAFLIKNAENNPAGYAVYSYSAVDTDTETQLRINSLFYDYNREHRESTFSFDGKLKQFHWRTTILRPGMKQPRNYSVEREADGTITIQTDTGERKSFNCAGLLVPELLLEECGAFFLKHGVDDTIVDVMASEGFVVPTRLEKLDAQNVSAQSEQIAAAVKTDFLHSQNSFDEFYFNDNGLLIGRFERQALSRSVWELSTTEQLKQIFGANYHPLSDNVSLLLFELNEF